MDVSLAGLTGRSGELGGFAETEEEFAVAVSAGDGGVHFADEVSGGEFGEGEIADGGEGGFLDGGIADDAAAFVDFGFAGFELRLHERDECAIGTEERPDGGEDGFQGDERKVHHDEIEVAAREVGGGEMAGVDFFEIGDASVGAEFGVELGAADIDADHIGGAGLEGAIGEAAGGGADVEDVGAVKIKGETLDGAREFFAAAGDEARRLFDREIEIGGKFAAGFVEALGAVKDATGHDERLRLGARSGETAGDEEFVEAKFFRGRHADFLRREEDGSFWRAGDQQVVRPPISARSRRTPVLGQRPPSRQR